MKLEDVKEGMYVCLNDSLTASIFRVVSKTHPQHRFHVTLVATEGAAPQPFGFDVSLIQPATEQQLAGEELKSAPVDG